MDILVLDSEVERFVFTRWRVKIIQLKISHIKFYPKDKRLFPTSLTWHWALKLRKVFSRSRYLFSIFFSKSDEDCIHTGIPFPEEWSKFEQIVKWHDSHSVVAWQERTTTKSRFTHYLVYTCSSSNHSLSRRYEQNVSLSTTVNWKTKKSRSLTQLHL